MPPFGIADSPIQHSFLNKALPFAASLRHKHGLDGATGMGSIAEGPLSGGKFEKRTPTYSAGLA